VHTFKQAPQLLLSVVKSLHIPPQLVFGEHEHALVWQVAPPVHTVPQAPQLLLSICKFVQKDVPLSGHTLYEQHLLSAWG
jgi:hypothetical protein